MDNNLYGINFRSSAPKHYLAFLMDFYSSTLPDNENAVQTTQEIPDASPVSLAYVKKISLRGTNFLLICAFRQQRKIKIGTPENRCSSASQSYHLQSLVYS